MAEILAFTASVVAVVQIADRVVNICKFYIETMRDTPSDLRLILLEISALKTVLENVTFLTSCPSEKSTILATLSGQGPIEGCRRSICDLEKLFPSNTLKTTESNPHKKQKVKTVLAALEWPRKEERAKKLLDEILRHKATITVALTIENTRDIKKIKKQTSDLHRILTESQRQEVLKWLQHTDPSPFHHQARKNFEPGTGDWVLRVPEWIDWLESRQRCLWLHGIPGAGKTVLISHLIDQTQKHCQSMPTNKCACVYYYFYFGHDRDETVPFLLWLLNQLCRQGDMIPEDVYEMYKRGGQPDSSELLNAVARILNQFETAYIIVDAIDESNPREDLLQVLRVFVTNPLFHNIQLLASSREYVDIERVMQPISAPISMANSFVEEDIKTHIRSVLRTNPRFNRWSLELLAEVEQAVSKGAKGMFRWAVCQIDALQNLKGEFSIIREALANLPKDLDETYDRVLLMVPEEEQLFVQHALQWIRFHGELRSGEPFSCAILLQAVTKSTADLGLSVSARYYDVEILRELCGCLVKIESEPYDPTGSGFEHIRLTASFAHFTVQEYLDSSRTSKSTSNLSIACKDSLWQDFTEILFRGALDLKICKFLEKSPIYSHGGDIAEALGSHFDVYSAVSAFLSLGLSRTLQAETLRILTYDFLNPNKQHYKSMQELLHYLQNWFQYFNNKGLNPTALWKAKWDENSSNADAVFLCNLLQVVSSTSKQNLLAKCFLDGKDSGSVLQARVKLEKRGEEDDDIYNFDGPLINLLVGLSDVRDSTLRLLLEYEGISSNPSALLFNYLGRHNHNLCNKNCLVEQFLKVGADPSGLAYKVTPLHVAVDLCDPDGAEALLRAGANPNLTGIKNGVIWNEKSFIPRFDHLHGRSPLSICRKNKPSHIDNLSIHLVGYYKKLEALLIKYGAEDFQETQKAIVYD